MQFLRRHRPRSAYDLMAALSLFLVVAGGGAYAAATIGAAAIKDDAVRSRHIRNGEVKNPDIAPDSIGTGKVLNGTLLAADFKAGELPRGEPGPRGPGSISFNRTVPYATGFHGQNSSLGENGLYLGIICDSDGVGFFIGGIGSGVGAVGTQSVNFGPPTAVHTGGDYVQFVAGTSVDLDVMVSQNAQQEWVHFKLYSIRRTSQQNCTAGGLMTQPG